MSVTVLIPHHNRRDLLARVIPALARQTAPHRVLVIDNGSTDGSRELAASMNVELLTLPGNFGFAYAVNRGIESTHTDWVAVVNNDVVPEQDWLERLLNADAPFACGKLLQEADPARLDGSFDLLATGGIAWRAGHGYPADDPEWSTPREIQFAPMTAALFRRDVFEKAGLLDETFESYLEDVDFGLRCALLGIRGRYVPEAVATHRGSATLGAWRKETVRLISRNQILLVKKHYPSRLVWRHACRIGGGQALWGALAARHGCGIAWMSGKWQGLKGFRDRRVAENTKLDAILAESEAELLRLQHRHGPERFWRAYRWLT